MFPRADVRALIRGGARAGLVPAAALAVHQLRYVLAFGGSAGAELARQGHSYLHSLVPWVVLSLAVALGGFLRALGRALAGQRTGPRYTVSLGALWVTCAAGLLAVYVAQELLEGIFAAGHPAGLAGIFGYGGCWSIPAALCVGLVLAALFHGARWALDEVARRASGAPRRRRLDLAPSRSSLPLLGPAPAPLAGGWSGRGPPA